MHSNIQLVMRCVCVTFANGNGTLSVSFDMLDGFVLIKFLCLVPHVGKQFAGVGSMLAGYWCYINSVGVRTFKSVDALFNCD